MSPIESDRKEKQNDHVFAPLHEPLVDDLARIVFSGRDMDGFLHDGISTNAEGLSSSVLKGCENNICRRKIWEYLVGQVCKH